MRPKRHRRAKGNTTFLTVKHLPYSPEMVEELEKLFGDLTNCIAENIKDPYGPIQDYHGYR